MLHFGVVTEVLDQISVDVDAYVPKGHRRLVAIYKDQTPSWFDVRSMRFVFDEIFRDEEGKIHIKVTVYNLED